MQKEPVPGKSPRCRLFLFRQLLHANFCVILSLLPLSIPSSGKEVSSLIYLINFIVSVAAQVVGYFLCKWLDPDNKHKGE